MTEARIEIMRLLPAGFGWLFDALDVCMEVVEEQGLMADKGLNFSALAPQEELRGLSLDLYRAHCVELCERWKGSAKTKTGRDRARSSRMKIMDGLTRAEVLAGLVHASHRAPLNQVGLALYARLFTELMPDVPPEITDGLGHERYAGQVDEELTAALSRTVHRDRGDQ